MENTLKLALTHIGEQFIFELEKLIANPTGTCYIIGHCLAKGFKKAGYNAREVTGTAIYKDKYDKNIIYGKANVKGKRVGYYHTWCVVNIGNAEITLDPSYKCNKSTIRKLFDVKLNKNIPDIIVTDIKDAWLYRFTEDDSLKSLSKMWLDRIDKDLLEDLINKISKFISENLTLKT